MRYCFAVIFFLLSLTVLRAQERYSFTHYSSEDGLSQNTVMYIFEDSNGFMWFTTWDGINKFDGYSFKTYKATQDNTVSFENNRVDFISEDKYGFLWILTYDNKAHRFDPKREEFTQIPTSAPENQYHISSIKILENGHVWLLTEKEGAFRFTYQEDHQEISSRHYSVSSGLLQAYTVSDVFLDNQQNEWLLTDNGLAFIPVGNDTATTYFAGTPSSGQTDNLSFHCYLEQPECIWFGSKRGRIWKFKKDEQQFQSIDLPATSSISGIAAISPEELAIGTHKNGFFIYQTVTSTWDHYTKESHREMPGNQIRKLYVDSFKEIWLDIQDAEGVAHFNPYTRQIKQERVLTEPGNAFRSQPYFFILEDINGYLWVHPYGGGFSYFDRDKNTLIPFFNEPRSPDWRFSNKLHSILSDRNGNLWMCTHSKGLEKISFFTSPFHLITPETLTYESLINDARSIFEDQKGRIWMGSREGIIRIYDQQMNYQGFLTTQGTIARSGTQLPGVAYHITQDKENNIWISTKGEGLIKLTEQGDRFLITSFKNDPDDPYSLSNDNLYYTHQDANGRIWIASFGGGLNYLHETPEGEYMFIHPYNHLKGWPIDQCYRVRIVTSGPDGRMWVGTTSGVVSFDCNFTEPENITFHHYYRSNDNEYSLSNNDVYSILINEQNEVFLGTFGGGLNKLVHLSSNGEATFKSYTQKEGLPGDVLLCVEKDHKGNLWISTENGLCKFNPSTEITETYNDKSFNFRAGFNEGSALSLRNGNMIFGTSNGMLYFSPDSTGKSDYIPSVIFTQFQLANEDIHPGQNSLLEFIPNETNKLTLTHRDNIFTIRYAALDMKAPENIQYAYILEGFEKDWNYVDKQRFATYTNLPKGEYTFKVKSTNSDGVWVENIRDLYLVILPSFWQTPWAYMLYILGILGIMGITLFILLTIYRLKNEVFIEQQISDIKLRFFTNISHELRTPLTLISGPVDHVLKNGSLPPEVREQLQLVERNTSRMLRLINQILDFRKIQNKKMKLRVQRVDLVLFVRRVMENFESLAEIHRIDFILETEIKELYIWVDIDKLEKIVFNLVSNAFKYTPEEKMIKVFIREDEQTVTLGVQDQGIGIAENRKESIFVRFENLMDKNVFNNSSTGIGLSLAKELVEMHKATITVESKLNEGSTFLVQFRKGKLHFDQDTEFLVSDYYDSPLSMKPIDEIIPQDQTEQEIISDITEEENKELMLIVEDNHELRSFLRTIFKNSFRIVEAVDGTEGLTKAQQVIPDIIISDVMMPGKNGIELVQEIRNQVSTSHIPVILLTAKSSIDSKLKGLEFGADDYITKPFSSTYLQARVESLLKQRKNLQDLYRTNLMPHTESTQEAPEVKERETEMAPNDRRFMDKLVILMEQQMDNSDLVVDDLVKELAVSRSVFFKKLKALTGLAPVEFIKEMRIKRAAQLIETNEYSMTQISYMVGINDSRYFSKCFKQQFGMTPTEYKEQKLHQNGQNLHTRTDQ